MMVFRASRPPDWGVDISSLCFSGMKCLVTHSFQQWRLPTYSASDLEVHLPTSYMNSHSGKSAEAFTQCENMRWRQHQCCWGTAYGIFSSSTTVKSFLAAKGITTEQYCSREIE